MKRLRIVLLGLLVLLLFGAPAFAQRDLVTAEIEGGSTPVRSGAPVTISWRIISQAKGLLEGHLQLTVLDGDRPLNVYRSEDVVIAVGDQTIKTTLAAMDVANAISAADIKLTFIGKREKIELGTHTLRAPGYGQRVFVVGFCNPWQSSLTPARQEFVRSFQFEGFRPKSQLVHQGSRDLATYVSHVPPGDMANDPLGYCGFDLMVLVDQGFSDLREKQLTALEAWVEAGGSLCVAPSGNLTAAHVDFLNKLAGTKGEAPPFARDATGKLVDSRDTSEAPVLTHQGLGRAAVLVGAARQDSLRDTPAGRQVLAFLWKVRQDQLASFVDAGQWDEVLGRKHLVQLSNDDYLQQYQAVPPNQRENLQLSTFPIQSGDQLLQRLMPESVQVIPMWVMGLILFVYVLLIGPGDYFILGRLKLRKLTWITFPAVTISVTLFTMWLSNRYMRTTDRRKAAVFLDIGENNRIARANRFELLFSGTPRVMTTPINRGIFAPLDHQMFGGAVWQRYANPNAAPQLVEHARFEGRIPSQYTVLQNLPQWTPQLNRILSLAPAEPAPQIDWDALGKLPKDAPDPFLNTKWREAAASQVRQAFGPDASIFLVKGHDVQFVSGLHGADLFPNQFNNPYRVYNGKQVVPNFLADVCGLQPSGVFTLVSQIAPGGGRNFDDLTLLDSSDPQQWMLVVAVQRGDDLLIYRKVYRGAN